MKELEKIIVDKNLFQIIKKQIDKIGDFKEALNQGIWMLNKKEEKVNRIRHVRCFVTPKGQTQIKLHSHLSKHEHKYYMIAETLKRPIMGYTKVRKEIIHHMSAELYKKFLR